MTKTRTELRFHHQAVANRSLTVEAALALFSDGEWPLDVSVEPDWMGRSVVVVALTTENDTDGDASMAEFEEHASRTGREYHTTYIGVDPTWTEVDTAARAERDRAAALAWLARH
jgi:hypothetical protein